MLNRSSLGGRRLTPIRLAAGLLAVAMLGCKTDDLLVVTDPDVARPDALTGVAAIPTLRAGPLGDFGAAYNGSNADVEQVRLPALIAGEFINEEHFPNGDDIDQVALSLSNDTQDTP